MSSKESGNRSGKCMGFEGECPYNARVEGKRARCNACQKEFREDEIKQDVRGLMRLTRLADKGHGFKIAEQMLKECE